MATFIKTGSRRNLRQNSFGDDCYVRSMNLYTVFLANTQANILTVILFPKEDRRGIYFICFKFSIVP